MSEEPTGAVKYKGQLSFSIAGRSPLVLGVDILRTDYPEHAVYAGDFISGDSGPHPYRYSFKIESWVFNGVIRYVGSFNRYYRKEEYQSDILYISIHQTDIPGYTIEINGKWLEDGGNGLNEWGMQLLLKGL